MAKPTENKPEDKLTSSPNESVTVFIHSKGIETVPKKIDGKTRHFVTGAINLEPFEVECDKHVEVPQHVAEVLKPLIER